MKVKMSANLNFVEKIDAMCNENKARLKDNSAKLEELVDLRVNNLEVRVENSGPKNRIGLPEYFPWNSDLQPKRNPRCTEDQHLSI